MPECVYLGRRSGVEVTDGGEPLPVFQCRHPAHRTTTEAACAGCGDRIADIIAKVSTESPSVSPEIAGESVATKLQPTATTPLSSPPEFYKPTGPNKADMQQIDLRGMYRGATAFLALGGPSMNHVPAYQLLRRGVIIASTNNNPAALPAPVRPHIWLHTDDPRKFHDSLWRDPTILKFSPFRTWRHGYKGKSSHYMNVRKRVADGFEPLGPLVTDMPNVIGFHRESNFCPETFLQEPGINRGNCKRSSRRNHYPHVINTMFSIVKVLYVLGFRRVYLLGADFSMDAARPYAFNQGKSDGGVNANNSAFTKMNAMFRLLQPRMLAAGFEVYNTTQPSGLTAFPFADLGQAIDDVAGKFENQLDGRGWYE